MDGYTWQLQEVPKPMPKYWGNRLLFYKGEFTGYWIQHCGHQTALRPYHLFTPTTSYTGQKSIRKIMAWCIEEHIKTKKLNNNANK